MKKNTLSLALFLAMALAALNAAEQKIATVDLARAFKEYYKTQIIDNDFQQQSKVYRNYIARQAESLRKDEQQYHQLRNSSLNIALNPAEREKRQAEADKLERALKMRRAELEQYAADRAKALQTSAETQRLKVLDEIRAEVRRRATIEGYTLVLDSSGMSMNQAVMVLYSVPAIDITDRVITELNRGAQKPATTAKK